VYAHLAYADYRIGRSYVLTDTTEIRNTQDLYRKDFWKDYFVAIEKVLNWEIFRGSSSEMMTFAAEGTGVSGVTVTILDRGLSSHSLIAALREFSQDITIRAVGQNFIKEILEGFAEKLGYDDVTLVDLNMMDFTVYRLRKDAKKRTLSTPLKRDYTLSEGKIRWSSKPKLMEAIRNAKLKAFLTIDTPGRRVANLWANYVLKQVSRTSSEPVVDLVRAYTTVQLLSITNDNPEKFEGMGELVDGTAVFLTGDLLNIMPTNLLVMSVLDGLEIRGGVDMFIDRESRVFTLGKNYSEGIRTTGFIASPPDIFTEVYKVLVPEIDGRKGERKVILTGRVSSESGKESEIFAVAPEFTQVKLDFEMKRLNVEADLIKGAYLDEYGERITFVSNPDKVRYTSLIVDGRYKPVVYGPDPKTNRAKINEWFDEKTW
jgi:hypothetical protein